jgi:hypothetical protein
MLWLRLVYIFIAMVICCLGAGISVARRLVDEPKIALVTSAGIGGIVLYLLAGGIYISGISWNWSYVVTGGCAIALIAEWREIKRWWRDPQARQLLIGWILVELWIVLVNLNIRHFALWVSDWEEHYNRARFFLEHWPLWVNVFGDNCLLPARPPLMNIIESLFLAQSGTNFGDYQMVSGFLNGMLYLAVAGLAMDWSGKRIAIIAAAVLALNPWFMQNATFTWTKLYSEFYVVLGIWLYRRQFRELAMLMLTAACLVHYSAVVVPVYIALYDILFNRRLWRRIVGGWLASALLMATWAGWGIATYGKTFVQSTSTVMAAQQRSRMELIQVFIWNGWHSLVPIGFEPWAILKMSHSYLHFDVKIRDGLFLAYQPGLILSWGVGGLIVMVWCLAHSRFARGGFWIGLVLFTSVGGLLMCTPPGYGYGGVAHIVMQPIAWIGMAWILSRLTEMPGWLISVWCVGVFLDAMWLMLHFSLESIWLRFTKYGTSYSPMDVAVGTQFTIGNALTQVVRNIRFLGMETVQYDALFLTAMICAAFLWWMSMRQSLYRVRK